VIDLAVSIYATTHKCFLFVSHAEREENRRLAHLLRERINSSSNAKPAGDGRSSQSSLWLHADFPTSSRSHGSASFLNSSRTENGSILNNGNGALPDAKYYETPRSNHDSLKGVIGTKENLRSGSDTSRVYPDLEGRIHVLLNIQKNLEKAVEDERHKRMARDSELRELVYEKERCQLRCSELEAELNRAQSSQVCGHDMSNSPARVFEEMAMANERLKEEKAALERALAREKATVMAAMERETLAFLNQKTSARKEADHVATLTAKVRSVPCFPCTCLSRLSPSAHSALSKMLLGTL
jgi:hypothetical protein